MFHPRRAVDMTPDQQRRRRAAHAFIERGWHTLLLGPTRKPFRNCPACRPDDHGAPNPDYQPHAGVIDCPHPLDICHGYQAASLDEDHVLELLDRHPDANLGVSTGPSRLVIVDVDANRRGEPVPEKFRDTVGINDGWDVFALALERYKAAWPDTLLVGTPSGGAHLWFRLPDGVTVLSKSGAFGWLVDVKASRAYITAPGTRTTAGEYRRFGDVMDPIPAPDWLMHHLRVTGHFPAPRPKPKPRIIRTRTDRDGAGQERLDRIAATLESAPSGTGHGALCTATTAAAHLVADELVAEHEARDVIADAGRNRNRTEAEIAHAWRSALSKVGCGR
jgi:hypothetical protein